MVSSLLSKNIFYINLNYNLILEIILFIIFGDKLHLKILFVTYFSKLI